MSRLSKLFAAACFSLSLAACGGSELSDEPTPSEGFSHVEQGVDPLPMCPAGDSLIYWDEPYGACGGCTVSRQPGQPWHHYAACSSNISGTRSMIGNFCNTSCELL